MQIAERDFQETYNQRIVAYIDILGFRTQIQLLNKKSTFSKKLFQALCTLENFRLTHDGQLKPDDNFDSLQRVSTFSDNIVLSRPVDSHAPIWNILFWLIYLVNEMLSIGVVLRGGISVGQLYHETNIILGEGLVNAYELESQVAIYPRIVIDDKVIKLIKKDLKNQKDLLKHYQMYIKRDFDGVYFLDHLACSETIAQITGTSGLDFDQLRMTVIKILQSKNLKISAKGRWYANYFNDFLEQNSEFYSHLQKIDNI